MAKRPRRETPLETLIYYVLTLICLIPVYFFIAKPAGDWVRGQVLALFDQTQSQ